MDTYALEETRSRFLYLAAIESQFRDKTFITPNGFSVDHLDVMNHWQHSLTTSSCNPEDRHPCGTVGCIAGETVTTQLYGVSYDPFKVPMFARHSNISSTARAILGLTEEEARALFFTQGWPIHIVLPAYEFTKYNAFYSYPVAEQFRIIADVISLFIKIQPHLDPPIFTSQFRYLKYDHPVVQEWAAERQQQRFNEYVERHENLFGYDQGASYDGIQMYPTWDEFRELEPYGDYHGDVAPEVTT